MILNNNTDLCLTQASGMNYYATHSDFSSYAFASRMGLSNGGVDMC